MAAGVQHFQALLAKFTVADLPAPSRKVVIVDSKASLIEGFETLIDNNIQSAPVFNKADGTYVGFLDIRDLVSFIRFVYDEQNVQDNGTLHDIIRHGVKMFNTLTTDGVTISYLARRNRFQPVQKSASLLQVAQLLAQGVHRVAVIDEQHQAVNIVSQSSIINFLQKHLNEPGVNAEAMTAISALNIGTRPVISVKKPTTVIETLRIMDSGRRSGVAIVDEHNRLVGTTTGKDLGLFIKHPTIATLEMPVFKFLSEVRQQSIDIKSPTIAVFPQDTLLRAISLLAATRVHRVFVVDNEPDFKPVAVISITDILNYIVNGHK